MVHVYIKAWYNIWEESTAGSLFYSKHFSLSSPIFPSVKKKQHFKFQILIAKIIESAGKQYLDHGSDKALLNLSH